MALNCEELRAQVTDSKRRRNGALVANATAKNEGSKPPYSTADLDALRLAVDVAALEARGAGCDIDDLVGPNVGRL